MLFRIVDRVFFEQFQSVVCCLDDQFIITAFIDDLIEIFFCFIGTAELFLAHSVIVKGAVVLLILVGVFQVFEGVCVLVTVVLGYAAVLEV